MIKRLLIANRGEIAVRIIRAAEKMGIETVAVYSEADAKALHVRLAGQAICIGPAPAAASYLSADAIIEAAKQAGADAIHPGYGFLSENAAFAKAVTDAGLIFVGPSANVIAQMGDKRTARGIAEKAGVPVVPGFDSKDASDDTLTTEAEKIGTPLMIKATAGGGGRGMRRVNDMRDFREALHSAAREAGAAFGDSGVFLERVIENARHVEVQILADTHGTVLHLLERDCSAQRRHQKVIEEAPCPTISDETREGLLRAAISLAKAVGYTGAGTVEFLVGEDGAFYFLEMNTRLQVEHPVTEMITGVDLVAEQLRIASGERLALTQDDIKAKGHAIEVRLYAEDPAQAFMPQTGTLGVLDIPVQDGTRLDSGVEAAGTVSPFYDPMLAKLIAFAPTRDEARTRLLAMLQHSRIAGVATNKAWLKYLLKGDAFRQATMRTHTLDHADPFLPAPAQTQAMTAAALLQTQALNSFGIPALAGWRTYSNPVQRLKLQAAGDVFQLDITEARTPTGWVITVRHEDETRTFEVAGDVMKHKGCTYPVTHFSEGHTHHFDLGKHHITVENITHAPAEKADATGTGQLTAPMDGQVVAVPVEAGQHVKTGDLICVIEAMKMEHHIRADIDGALSELTASVGAQVKSRAPLATIIPGETA